MWAGKQFNEEGSLFFYLCPSGYCRCFLNTSFGDTLFAIAWILLLLSVIPFVLLLVYKGSVYYTVSVIQCLHG